MLTTVESRIEVPSASNFFFLKMYTKTFFLHPPPHNKSILKLICISNYEIIERNCLRPYNDFRQQYFYFRTYCTLLLLSKHRISSVVCSLFQPPFCSPREKGIKYEYALFRIQNMVCLPFISSSRILQSFRLLTFSRFTNLLLINTHFYSGLESSSVQSNLIKQNKLGSKENISNYEFIVLPELFIIALIKKDNQSTINCHILNTISDNKVACDPQNDSFWKTKSYKDIQHVIYI